MSCKITTPRDTKCWLRKLRQKTGRSLNQDDKVLKVIQEIPLIRHTFDYAHKSYHNPITSIELQKYLQDVRTLMKKGESPLAARHIGQRRFAKKN